MTKCNGQLMRLMGLIMGNEFKSRYYISSLSNRQAVAFDASPTQNPEYNN